MDVLIFSLSFVDLFYVFESIIWCTCLGLCFHDELTLSLCMSLFISGNISSFEVFLFYTGKANPVFLWLMFTWHMLFSLCQKSPRLPSGLMICCDSQDSEKLLYFLLHTIYYRERIQINTMKRKRCIMWSPGETRHECPAVLSQQTCLYSA